MRQEISSASAIAANRWLRSPFETSDFRTDMKLYPAVHIYHHEQPAAWSLGPA